MKKIFRRQVGFLVASALLACSGCSVPVHNDDGTLHYLVIGLGIVSVPDPIKTARVTVVKEQSLGVSLSNQPGTNFSLGYSSNTVVRIPVEAGDVSAEVSGGVLGPLKVESKSVLKKKDE